MSVVRGTGMSNYSSLVAELAGAPANCCAQRASGCQDIGKYEAFIPVPRGDTGDRIGRRIHGHIGLRAAGTTAGHRDLGPVGVAARTAATVADALGIFSTYMAAYRPVIAMKAAPLADPHSAMQ